MRLLWLIPGEEGKPAEKEGAHDDAQGDEGLVLLAPRGVDTMPLAKSWIKLEEKKTF